jgi:hypothetical protein
MRMKKFLPHLVWLTGLLIVIVGIAVGPGVPYQDPTPEMRAFESRQEQRSRSVAITGFCIFAGGVVWGASRRLIRRFSQKAVL